MVHKMSGPAHNKHREQNLSGRQGDLSIQYNAEAKNEWSYTSTPPRTFMVCKGKLYTLHASPDADKPN